jgi:uncharacterized RDD family membrane protein YckC
VETVSFWRRVGALFIDWVVAALTASAITGAAYSGEGAANPFIPLLVFLVEVTLLLGLLGTTIGKRLLGLKVIGPDGRGIGLPRAFVRTALLCLVIPAVVMNDEQRGLHDIAARSRVVAA